jgi:hypothetical protein
MAVLGEHVALSPEEDRSQSDGGGRPAPIWQKSHILANQGWSQLGFL